jgi:hypothetical protein
MSYVIFKYEPRTDSKDKIKALSLLFLTPEASLKGYDGWTTGLERKPLEKLKLLDMITFVACHLSKVYSVSIIKFPNDFTTDKHFIDSFGDNYIGMLPNSIKKQDLLERCTKIKDYRERHYFQSWGKLHLTQIKRLMTDNEFNFITKLTEQSLLPVNKWIDNWIKESKDKLDKSPKLISRNF